MINFCYLLTFVFEQFIAYIYYDKKLIQKISNTKLLTYFSISFLLQYVINFTNIPYLNLLTFFICNSLVVYFCYYASLKQVLFNVISLESLMIITELIIIYCATLFFKIDLKDYSNNTLIFILETIGTKTLYFTLAYTATKISFKEKKNILKKDYSYLLFFLPLTSVILIMSLVYVSINLDLDQTANILFMVISFLLLIINIIVFLVHEKIISTLTKNTELQLEKQKEKINKEYYTELEKQYNSSNILIHDITKCLLNIRALSNEKDNEKIIEYIDSIYNGYEIKFLKQYSNNKLVNVIASRYAHLCDDEMISIEIDIRNIDFSFMNDCDLTALLDNLLENAYEATRKSKKKEIELKIDIRNEKYILFHITNSCDTEPKMIGNFYLSTKNDNNLHGIGLKSISRIIKRYSGKINCDYNNSENRFCVSILLKNTLKQ